MQGREGAGSLLWGLVLKWGEEQCLWADDMVKNATASTRASQVQGHG